MRQFVLFLSLLFVLSCSDQNSVPKDIIAKDKMGKILWDLVQADQYSTQYLVKDSAKINVKQETMKLYEEVFRIHHITKDEFQKSFAFYLAHPDITKVMFDSISANANRQRMQVYRNTPRIPTKLNVK